jgi:hypothetical protein
MYMKQPFISRLGDDYSWCCCTASDLPRRRRFTRDHQAVFQFNPHMPPIAADIVISGI